MKTPGESNPGTGENQPMASDAEKDALIMQAGELFGRAFEGYKEAVEEPDEPTPGVLGVLATADELAQYPTLSRWNTADIQYAPPHTNEDLPADDPGRVSPPHLMATFSLAGTASMEAIDLTPSSVEGESMSDEERGALLHEISADIPRAEVQDIAALLQATVTTERLEFPGLPPEALSAPPPTEQI